MRDNLLALFAFAAFILVVFYGHRRGIISLRGIGAGISAVVVAASAAALLGYLLVQVVDALKNGDLRVGMGGTYNVHHYELGLLVINLVLTAAIYVQFQKRANTANLLTGALIFWLLLTIGSSIFLAGASYIFLWPLLAGLTTLFIELLNPGVRPPIKHVLRLVPVTIGLILAGTTVYLVSMMFGVDGFPATGTFGVLILTLLFPYLDFRSLPRPLAWLAVPTLSACLQLA